MLFCLFHDLLSSPISQHSVWSEIILIFYSLLYHSLEWLHQCNKCILQDYGITFLFHDRRATTNTGLRTARSTGHAWSRFSGVGYGMLSHSRQCSCNGPFFSAKWMTPSMLMGMSL